MNRQESNNRSLLLCYWGVIFSQFDMVHYAERCFLGADTYFERNKSHLNRGFTLFVWGYIREFVLGESHKSLAKIEAALKIHEQAGEWFWRILNWQAQCQLEYFGGHVGLAEKSIPKLMEGCDRIKSLETPKNCTIKWFMIHGKEDRVREVIRSLERDLKDERHGDSVSLDSLFSYLSMGEYYFYQGELEKACLNLKKANWLCFRHIHRVAYAIYSPIMYARALQASGQLLKATLPLLLAWANQLTRNRIFLPQTLFATGEYLASWGMIKIALQIVSSGIKAAKVRSYSAVQAEGLFIRAKIRSRADHLRAVSDFEAAEMIWSDLNWPFFVEQASVERMKVLDRFRQN